ncbi:MAG: hypothetical protein A3G25_07940 [Betaproteobacteria bacterium RIFCSPLOWO2_12_FULL_63_13]|nr:MAG: hypothetical protein A3H32_21005 [Betaproteobacteria bacterium RIFCSPLOWO2_02_FULL_63_19]OGA53431.1 MAG: hypothetical protein A3G25_07940 [Betaproteobacteria bacterium RIFCSPLOWO2_12_FULL_63_13]
MRRREPAITKKENNAPPPLAIEAIAGRIVLLRGQRVMLDADLAALYGISTGRFNEAVRRNLARFPGDFMFPLTNQDLAALRSQIASLKAGRGQHRKYPPYAFTEHGAIMAATVLNSPRATEVSVYVVRAFVRLREIVATNEELAAKLEALERSTEALALRHDTLAANTRAQLRQVFDAIRELMSPVEPKRRPIGFITPEK